MKRLITLLFITALCLTSAFAQMTDDQVIEYAKAQTEAGKDQKSIAMELLNKGVTQDQLARIRNNVQRKQNTQNTTTGKETVDNLRVNNAEEVELDFDIPEDATRKIFGHDIFRSKNLSFEPNMNIATPSTYTLGPGDEVVLDIYGASQVNGTFKVSPDGNITIPNEGPVNVAGLTVTQAQNKVRKTIGGHYQGSSIKLTVGQTRTIIVNVMGEVKTPGTYTLSAFATVFNALYMAGGVNDIGTLRNIKVSRNGRIISTVDVYDYIMNGKLAGNVMLRDNDVIMVGPYENIVEITGKVKRPMLYEMKKNESLQSLLTLAGGFTGDAYKQNVRVERKSDEGLTVHNVDEWDFTAFHNEDGDVVVVAPVIERFKNTVSITGAVFRPGQYKLGGSVNSVKTLVEQAGGLDEQALTTRAVLHRMKADRTTSTQTINIGAILSGDAADVILQNEDQLIISSTKEITDKYTLSIFGDVVKPGQYSFSENETVEDLITEAGGLLESASLVNVEVARRIMTSEDNPDGTKMATIHQITLSDGLAIEGETGFKLRPYDIVSIHRNPDYQVQKYVYATGEVKYAGAYVLANKTERISDVIKRAGGLTEEANVNGAQLMRRISKKEHELQYKKLETAATAADSLLIMSDIEKTSYLVGINLKEILENPESGLDVELQEGDSLYIPKLNNTIKISGEVLMPNTVAFAKGKSASYYLNQAGGVTENGKKSKAYIVYANGQASMLSKGKIEPGCEIIVPAKVDKKVDSAKVSMWATLASTVATVGAVISTIVK